MVIPPSIRFVSSDNGFACVWIHGCWFSSFKDSSPWEGGSSAVSELSLSDLGGDPLRPVVVSKSLKLSPVYLRIQTSSVRCEVLIMMYIYISIGQSASGRGPEKDPRPRLLDEEGRRESETEKRVYILRRPGAKISGSLFLYSIVMTNDLLQ